MHKHNDIIKTTTQSWRKIYLSLYLKGLCVRGSWRPNRTATYWPPFLWQSVFLSRSPDDAQMGARGPLCRLLAFSTASCHQRVWSPKLTDFLSSSSYIIIQSPTQYLPITGNRNVSLPPSTEWHVWSSSSGNNCHTVHRSLSSGASVCDCTARFYLVPYCQPSPPTRFLPITGHRNVSLPPSLEWHVWPGRRSMYNSICFFIFVYGYNLKVNS